MRNDLSAVAATVCRAMSQEQERVTIRLGPDDVEALDALADEYGSRAGAIRSLIAKADPQEHAPMTEADLIAGLERQARGGSTVAIRLLLKRLRDAETRAHVDRLNALTRSENPA